MTGSLYPTVRVLPAVMLAETTSGGRPSSRVMGEPPSNALLLPSRSCDATSASIPVALVASMRSPVSEITCMSDPPTVRIEAVWLPASPSTATLPYAPDCAVTSSLYHTVASLPPVMRASSILGAIPSATAISSPAGRSSNALPAGSVIGSPASYRSAASGLSLARPSPPRVRTSSVPGAKMPERSTTALPPESAPDTIQPPAADASDALTGSLNATRILLRSNAVALTTEGAWPSRTVWLMPSITIQPVESGLTVAGSQNVTSTVPWRSSASE